MAKKQASKKELKRTGTAHSAPAAGSSGAAKFFFNRPLQCGLILLLSLVLYANTLRHGYTQDDALVIYDNMYTTQGIKGIPGILQYDTFKGFFKVEGKEKLVAGGRYRPLTLIMFALEWQLFKKVKKDTSGQVQRDVQGNVIYEGNTFVGHLMNVLFYGLTGIMLYLLLLRMLANADPLLAGFVAVAATWLFIAHPIHTEAVANIKGRDEIITLLGSLTAVYFALRAYQDQKPMMSVWAAIAFFLALLSKENAITFVAVVPLVFYFFTKADTGTIVKQTLYFLGVAVLFMFVRAAVLGWDFGEPSKELMNNPFLKLENGQWVFFSFGEKMATIFFTLGKYVLLLFFPHPLTHDYYPRQIAMMSWTDWRVLLSFALYVALAVYAFLGIRKKDPVSFGILFYLLTLSIVSNIVFPVGTNMSERFLFMPSVGFCFLIAYLGYRLVVPGGTAKAQVQKLIPVFGVLGVALILLSGKTITRNKAWKDNFTLFTNDIEYSPNSAKLRNSVGAELSIRSQQEKDEGKKTAMLNEAIAHLQEAVRIHPTYENAYLQLGNCYNYLKQYNKALEYYNQVLRMDPNDINATNNIGIAYRDSRQYDLAVKQFEKLRALGEPNAEVNLKLAFVHEEAAKYYSSLGQQDLAIAYFNQAIPLSTEKDKLTYFLGVAYGLKKDYPKAIEALNNALSLTTKPDNKLNIYRTLSGIYQEMGDNAKATEYLQLSQSPAGN